MTDDELQRVLRGEQDEATGTYTRDEHQRFFAHIAIVQQYCVEGLTYGLPSDIPPPTPTTLGKIWTDGIRFIAWQYQPRAEDANETRYQEV